MSEKKGGWGQFPAYQINYQFEKFDALDDPSPAVGRTYLPSMELAKKPIIEADGLDTSESIEKIWSLIFDGNLHLAFKTAEGLRKKFSGDNQIWELFIYSGRCLGKWEDDGYEEALKWIRSTDYSEPSLSFLTGILTPEAGPDPGIEEYWNALSERGVSPIEKFKQFQQSLSETTWKHSIERASLDKNRIAEAFLSHLLLLRFLEERVKVSLMNAELEEQVKRRLEGLNYQSRDLHERDCWINYSLYLAICGHSLPTEIYKITPASPLAKVVREAVLCSELHIREDLNDPPMTLSYDVIVDALECFRKSKSCGAPLTEFLVDLYPGLLRIFLPLCVSKKDQSLLNALSAYLIDSGSSNHDLLAQLSKLVLKEGHYQQALDLLDRSLEVEPSCYSCSIHQAAALAFLGKVGTARSIVLVRIAGLRATLLATESNNTELLGLLGQPHQLGAEAVAQVEDMLATSLRILGMTHLWEAEYETAAVHLEQSLSYRSAHKVTWRLLCRAYKGLGDEAGVKRCEEKLVAFKISTRNKSDTFLEGMSEVLGPLSEN